MKKPLILLSLIAALGAGPSLAQTAEGADPATPPAGTGLDLGQPAQDGRGPEPYVKEVFDDWTLQCLEVSADNEVCQMYQLLTDGNGANVAEVNIFRLQGGGQAVAGGTFTVPLETLLTQKLRVSIDGREAKLYDFSFCTVQGCFARVGFTAEDVNLFKAGNEAVITIVPVVAPDQTVSVSMSLAGFTAAYDEASELAP